ncbi:MAG: GTPase ObgE [Candidatus Omnitrophica bacterium]|nr:GTPase ObgE [Candidatus Omnitrophota bacterium]
MFIDQARIHVKAGDGGDGCTSFYRDRSIRKGKANGGPGGEGGNIIFKADKNMQTLLDFQYNRHFKAERGNHGSSNNKKGKSGKDLYVRVPPGTVLKDAETGLILRDLVEESEEVTIVKGGPGGRGNNKKEDGSVGEKGEERDLVLELKLIADVGIIGFPNVGKSTLISRISCAKSKVADYPFTTKEPILGIVELHQKHIAFADMPGLIENAHTGRGLGDRFLRHIERTKILIHMVDIAGVERRDAFTDYIAIRKELVLYGKHVEEKPEIIACNKMDLPEGKKKLEAFKKRIGKKIFPISAATGQGIDKLLQEIENILV